MNEPKPVGVYAVQFGSFTSYQDAKASGADYEIAQGCFDFTAGNGGANLDIVVALEELIAAINVGEDWGIVVVFDNGETQGAYEYFNVGYKSTADRLRKALQTLIYDIGDTTDPLRTIRISPAVLEHCKIVLNSTK